MSQQLLLSHELNGTPQKTRQYGHFFSLNKAMIIFVLICISTLTGCAYKPLTLNESVALQGAIVNSPISDSLAVLSGVDSRPRKDKASIGAGAIAFIPLVPFGKQEMTPDFLYRQNNMDRSYSFLEDITRLIARDLQQSQIFVKTYLPAEIRGDVAPVGSYVLKVILKESNWDRTFTTYGLSFGATYLWLVGAPCSYGNVQLHFDIELWSPSNQFLGKQTFSHTETYTEWIYAPFHMFERLDKAYEAISPSIRRFVLAAIKR